MSINEKKIIDETLASMLLLIQEANTMNIVLCKSINPKQEEITNNQNIEQAKVCYKKAKEYFK